MKNVNEFRKLPKSKATKNNKHSDEQANKWLKEYLDEINSPGYGKKGKSNLEFANNCNMTQEALEGKASGRYPIYASDIIAFANETGISADEILGIEKKNIPDNLKVKTNKKDINIEINMLSEKVCNEISKHILRDGLFPAQDEYLKFIEYLILEKEYIKNLLYNAKKSFDILYSDIQNNQLSKEELKLLDTHNKDYHSWIDAINNNVLR